MVASPNGPDNANPTAAATGDPFVLQLFHLADQEAGAPAVDDAPNLSAVLSALRAEDVGADATLTLSSGDAYIPGLSFDASGAVFGAPGVADIRIQNALGVEAIAFGNHEFDLGPDLVETLISGTFEETDEETGEVTSTEVFGGTDFPYLSANLLYEGSSLEPLVVEPGQAPEPNSVARSVVIEGDGAAIGVVGATTPTLAAISSPGSVGVEDPFGGTGFPSDAELDALAANVQDDVDALIEGGVDKVILLAHMQQIGIEQALAERLAGVDVIVAGGSNSILTDGVGPAEGVDELRPGDESDGDYPGFFTGADGAPVAVVNTDGNYRYLGRLVVAFDEEGRLLPESYDPAVSGPYRTDGPGVEAVGAAGLAAPEIVEIAGAIDAEIEATFSNVFGVTEVFLNGLREEVRSQETNLGNLTAEANLAIANRLAAELEGVEGGAVVSIKNGGGIRAPIGREEVPPGATEAQRFVTEAIPGLREEGEISEGDIADALRFNNGLTLLSVTREELAAILENGFAGAGPGATPGAFPQLAGLRVAVDLSREPGDRVVSAAIVDEAGEVTAPIVRDGEVVGDPGELFRVVTLSFLADGGDGYPFPDRDRVDLARADDAPRTGAATFAPDGTEQDALAEYLADEFATPETAFDDVDTPPAEDERIQLLSEREDTVFAGEGGGDGGGGPAPDGLLINEIQVSTAGADTEFVELLGAPGASLDGASLLVVESDPGDGQGVIDAVLSFDGGALGEDGLFLAATPEAEAAYAVSADQGFATNAFENSSATYLLVRGFTGAEGDDLDADDDGALDASPWETLLDGLSLLDAAGDAAYADVALGPDGTFLPSGAAREPEGGAFALGLSFGEPDGTPGAPNPDADGGDGPGDGDGGDGAATAATIMEIQGAGHVSPFVALDLDDLSDGFSVAGERVSTTGVVTAVDSSGFYLQDPEGDGDPATSDALFVFTGSAPGVAVGDAVAVMGTAAEFFPGGADTRNLPITQITDASVEVTASGRVLPQAVVIGAEGRVPPDRAIDDDGLAFFNPDQDGADFFESLEAMRVTVDDPLAVSATNRFGEIFTVADDGASATGLSDRGTINIAPGDFNPERVQIDADSTVSPGDLPLVDVGAALEDVTGVVSFSFGNYEVVPTEAVALRAESGLEPETTTLGGEDVLTIASYNVLNLDPVVEDVAEVADQDPGEVDDDVGDGRFEAIARQIVENLDAPDIVALQEIQNDDGAEISDVASAEGTLELLAEAILAAGGPAYEVIDTPGVPTTSVEDGELIRPVGGQPGGDIRNAFLYDPERVGLVEGSVRTLTDDDDDPSPFFEGRIPLVATFAFAGEAVTVVNNHFSSKGGSAPLFGTEQPFSELQEAPEVNGGLAERRDQAAAVGRFVEDALAADPDANLVVLGDLNEFEFVSPVEILEEAGLENLTERLPEDERYTFVFQGNSQSLDHILASGALAGEAAFDIVHVNAEFAETDARASDHDPLLAAFDLRAEPAVVAGGPSDDTLFDGPGDTRFVLGPEGASDRNVVVLGDAGAPGFGRNIVEDFDVDGGGEGSFDTLVFSFGEDDVVLSNAQDVAAFVDRLRTDGDDATDARLEGDDLVFAFTGLGSAIRLGGVADEEELFGEDGLIGPAPSDFLLA